MKAWFMFLKIILYPIAAILCPRKIMNKDKYKKYGRGQLVISNHLSWMDILYIYFGLPGGLKRTLSKKENEGNKLQSALMRSIGVIFVDRDKPELSSMRTCINALKDGQTLTICPEGTRNKVNRELQPLHSGAALFSLKGNAQVIPYVVHHKGKLFHRNYLGVGDPVDLSDLYGKRTDEATLAEATERFRIALQKTLDELDVWVEQKGWKKANKQRKKEIKADSRILKRKYKAAKKDYARSTHSK
ncbi:MAG: 1-acyl-sn-glycerol-3-phosphate acyltransferase [Clostridiales bacterium]|nr:1-acyl-sn-glycerol-3-phosphate acyltransferase [Clostridiales bacterium]